MWRSKKRVYLDWAAAAPVAPRALRVFNQAISSYGNPANPHKEGRTAKNLLEDARTTIARLAEVKTSGVIFTSGATEANALALLGTVRARGVAVAPASPAGWHLLYQLGQHASVLGAIRMLEAEGAVIESIEPGALARQLRPETVLVSMDAVNGETGEVFDTRTVRRTLNAHHSHVLLHIDAAQAPLTQSFALSHTGADLLTLDAQKVGGVRGIGVLLVRQGITLAPLIRGGAQEGGRRPGTESPTLAVAFACALTEASLQRNVFNEQAERMRTAFITSIEAVPYMVLNEGKRHAPNIVNLSVMGRDTDYLVALLDKEGFAVSTKSACESNSIEGSRAVLALTGDPERAAATLRISWGPTTSKRDLMRFAEVLIRSIRFLDKNKI